jgi:ligand-binding sensor domain-containing protein
VKSVLRTAVVLVLVALASSPAQSRKIEGAVHLGHTGGVRALLRTGETLWIGTGGGLYQYDLGSDDFTGHAIVGDRLPSSSIRALAQKDGAVYVGTDGGLAVWDGAATTVYTNRNRHRFRGLSFDRIEHIDVGPSGDIYISTFGHGVGVMREEEPYALTREDSLLDDKVYGVAEGEEGELFFATSMGLCAFRDSTWVGFQAGAGIPRGEVRAILPGSDRIYLLVGVGGVYRFGGDRAARMSPQGVLPGDDIAALTLDDRDVLWAAGRFGGLAVYQGGRWKRFGEEDADVNAARWRCAYADGEGGVFFGSADGLVVVIRDNNLRKIHIPQELPSGSVRSIVGVGGDVFFLCGENVVRAPGSLSDVAVEDAPEGLVSLAASDSGLWAAGRWGIFRRTPEGYREALGVTRVAEPAFTALCFDGRGRAWAALRSGAIVRYDGEIWLRMAEPVEVFNGPIDGLAAGGGGVWAWSRRGVARYDGSAWSVSPPDSFGGAEVCDLAVSPQGGVVAATAERVWLFRADTSGWRAVGFGSGSEGAYVFPRRRAVRCLAFDADGYLYVGTEDGLAAVRDDGLHWFGADEGLGGRAVAAVYAGDGDALWVGFRTDGLTRVPVKSLW